MSHELLKALSLEELIELCGDMFNDLTKTYDGTNTIWIASQCPTEHFEVGQPMIQWTGKGIRCFGKGSTPKEAVSNLYIKLYETNE